jgi:AhpC/TSA family
MRILAIAFFMFLAPRGALSQDKFRVIVFLSTECPVSQKYTSIIRQLTDSFPAVTFTVVFPGKWKKKKINLFTEKYFEGKINIISDRKYKLADKYKATITPEVFLVNGQNHVLYAGAINNWFEKPGTNRTVITAHYLKYAIDCALNGKEIEIKKTKAVGCLIEKN